MTASKGLAIVAAFLVVLVAWPRSGFTDKSQSASVQSEEKVYLGFDRNEYPGDAALPVLRKIFSFSGYWLTPPPNTSQNTWVGKRKALQEQGFGFLLLARGRPASTIQSDANEKGLADAREAARNAEQDGFGVGAAIFLDVEEGGRLPPQFHAYLRSWVDELRRHRFRPGVYCSGMPANDGNGRKILTSDDIRSNIGQPDIAYWVVNDSCPPSRGCTSVGLLGPTKSNVDYAVVWQFVRSPRSKETALECPGYAKDENCYAALDTAHRWHLDLDVASSSNPSAARLR
ncbi:MAG: hypothetical protein DMG50_05230 [Acidobacteria bacterium]|nr:MAG: hypothetical protein DMG50_05230 [Acidobacteriota bacterium]